MRKPWKVLAVITIAAFALASCGGSGSTGGQTTEKPTEIKIGWYYALTGDDAPWGQCEKNTAEMIFEELNAAGGVNGMKLVFVPYDNRGDNNESVKVVSRMINLDGVVAILGPGASGNALATSDILTESKIPAIATVATNPKVTVDGALKPYNFRVCFIDPYQGAVAAGYAFEKLGKRKAAILYDMAMDYSVGLTEFFEENFKKLGGEIVAKEAFKGGDVEFRAQLTKIKAANPDIIFLPYYYKEVAMTAVQARGLGLDQVMLGGDGWPSEELVPLAGDALEGCYFINHVDYDDPKVQDFKNKYYARYGINSEINGYLMYDAIMMLVDAIKRAEKVDGPSIAKALETTDFEGITGRIVISKDTHNPTGKEAAIIKIIGGKFVFQEKYAPKL